MTPQQRHAVLVDRLAGLVRDIAALHCPDEYDDCGGCDWGAYAEGAAPWPCRTIRLIEGEVPE